MSDRICDRKFELLLGEQRFSVPVEWMKPVQWRVDWSCEYIIHWPDNDAEVGRIFGLDSTQALLLSMRSVASILEDRGATWLDGWNGLGLPQDSLPEEQDG